MTLTTEEEMAFEVLKGNFAAARALADKLIEEQSMGIHLPPLKSVSCSKDKIRVVVFFSLQTAIEARIDIDGVKEAIQNWLDNPGSHLVLVGVERIDLYEIP